jgi:hypothetical protein
VAQGRLLKNPQPESDNVVLPTGGSDARPASPVAGSFRYNVDLGQLEYFNGSVFNQVSDAGEVDIVVDEFTGDGSTLTFSLSVTVSGVNQVLVFVGNIYQQPSTYTITGGGDDITFTEAPPEDASINVILNIASTDAS